MCSQHAPVSQACSLAAGPPCVSAVTRAVPGRPVRGPTFLLGWVDARPEAPVWTAAGHLDQVEAARAGVGLGAREGELQQGGGSGRVCVRVCLTTLRFSTSTKTSIPAALLSSTVPGWPALLTQADARTLSERLLQMKTVWRNTRCLGGGRGHRQVKEGHSHTASFQ